MVVRWQSTSATLVVALPTLLMLLISISSVPPVAALVVGTREHSTQRQRIRTRSTERLASRSAAVTAAAIELELEAAMNAHTFTQTHSASALTAAARTSAHAKFNSELLYPCFVCIRTLNSFLSQWHEWINTNTPIPLQPRFNSNGICQPIPTNLVRIRDFGPCLRYENGICLKRFGRPGVIDPRAHRDDGDGTLDNPFTRVFGERPQPNVTMVMARDSHNQSVPVPLGNDTWCNELVTELSTNDKLTALFKGGCTIFPSLTLDEYWAMSEDERPKSASDMLPKYYRKADNLATDGCRMRDACSCLKQANQMPYCPTSVAEFNDPEYWSEPDDFYLRRRKSMAQRRMCVAVGAAAQPPPQPKLPPPLPVGADAPRLIIQNGKEVLIPTVMKPIAKPGIGIAALKKAAGKKSVEYLKKMQKKADEDAKKAEEAGKKLQKDRKAGPPAGPIQGQSPN